MLGEYFKLCQYHVSEIIFASLLFTVVQSLVPELGAFLLHNKQLHSTSNTFPWTFFLLLKLNYWSVSRPTIMFIMIPLFTACNFVYKFHSRVYKYEYTIVIWVKRDQLDVTCFIISLLNAQHVLDVNTSILRSLRLMCWVISWVTLIWFDVCWSYAVVWLWWCGKSAYGYHTNTAKPQRNTNTHRTRSIQPMK